MATTLLLTVPTTRILEDHAEYGISCALNSAASGGGTVVVWRRYKDFENLRNELQRITPSTLLPNLPSKHTWWTSRSPEIVHERQRQFETFLREIEVALERHGPAWNLFCQFVGVSPSVVANSAAPIFRVEGRGGQDSTTALRDEVLRLQNEIALLEDQEAKLKLDLATKDTELASFKSRKVETKTVKEQSSQLEKEKNYLAVEVARLEALLNSAGDAQHELNLAKEEENKLRNQMASVESERDELLAAQTRHDELVQSLRREVARLEEENQRMQAEIGTLQRQLEVNPKNEEVLREEIKRLKKENGALQLEIARLEQAQQSAAAYGANVLSKLEKLEREKAEQLNVARTTIESEAKISQDLRAKVAELERQLKDARETLARTLKDVEQANMNTAEVSAANEMLQSSMSGEESEIASLRKEVEQLQAKLAEVYAEYEIVKARSRMGDGEVEAKLESLGKQMLEYKSEAEKNASIKMKLAARLDTLVAENLHLKEKNLSLERRNKLLQGD